MWLIALLMSLLLFSCTPESPVEDLSGVEVPEDVNLMELDCWTQTIPIQIESDQDWKVEIEGDAETFYTIPEEGSGDGTVKLCVTKNVFGEHQEARMKISFPESGGGSDIVYDLRQKSVSDYADTVALLGFSNEIYVVGYGYNAGERYADITQLKAPILDFEMLSSEGKIGLLSPEENFSTRFYTAASASDLSRKLSVHAKGGINHFGFSGEIGASFTKEQIERSSSEFALTYLDYALQPVTVEVKDPSILATQYLTPAAYDAINGIDDSRYPSTPEGFEELISNYGTHLIVTANLGGRLKYSLCTDVSEIEGAYSLSAYAKAGYKNFFVNVEVEVSNEYKESYKKNSRNLSLQVDVAGGDVSMARLAKDDTDEHVTAWKNSLKNGLGKPGSANAKVGKGHNLTWIGSPENGMIPLYDLVDRNKFPERYTALRRYMTEEETGLENAVPKVETVYNCPHPVHFSVPGFPAFHYEGYEETVTSTLVKDVLIGGGHSVAKVCQEYIPQLNKKQRVTVIYPVFSNKIKMNMGYYIGDEAHAPATVCWQRDESGELQCLIQPLPEEGIGAKRELWLSGASFSNREMEGCVEGGTKDFYMLSYKQYSMVYYPVVKVFDNFWTRENLYSLKDHAGRLLDKEECVDYEESFRDRYLPPLFYSYKAGMNEFLPPYGWHVASSAEYESIVHELEKNDISMIGLSFVDENSDKYGQDEQGTGCLGLEIVLEAGWLTQDNRMENFHDNGYQTLLWTSDAHMVTVHSNSSFDVSPTDGTWPSGGRQVYGHLRLVKDKR